MENIPKALFPRVPLIFDCVNYMIVNKPYAVLAQPGATKKRLPNGQLEVVKHPYPDILSLIRDQYGSGIRHLGEWKTVHRIDKCVTGGMLITKNENAVKMFSRNLKKGGNTGYKISRKYVALLEGTPTQSTRPSGIIGSKVMQTRYKRFDDNCIIFELLTGKKHQLRLQCQKFFRQPILNDKKYGAGLVNGAPLDQIALHSAFISTVVGFQKRGHHIPMVFNNDGNLWDSKYVDLKGNFIPEIQALLEENWDDEMAYK
ncbi:hypothetical protein TBLA_0H03150 [Henningerozyma blattae CBS 6284]|uniref:21S rRNA pseudouridine(2819) synthase n=1 Tax=Henningerozyma blattae (strain ATCC 34711 / CBS 6284 / DSM 70876 / NBRC 10599 / NRRL Y-10934 / UCD 77-7) TaxID=1071380 RepID=I2H894_HENB6|nr:hypothetical protein TBLA_0H03150 [Tetrapisispora blattae CBS 6284]CCH62596.1 hypothetical protein TBLA_0H03150 [Tetrapisispora blattae CBS 6284]